jgi:hypothetical protein
MPLRPHTVHFGDLRIQRFHRINMRGILTLMQDIVLMVDLALRRLVRFYLLTYLESHTTDIG